jgi:hypothetical protein
MDGRGARTETRTSSGLDSRYEAVPGEAAPPSGGAGMIPGSRSRTASAPGSKRGSSTVRSASAAFPATDQLETTDALGCEPNTS